MPACSALGCRNRPCKKIPGISFHRFPANKQQREAWTKACRRKNWKPSKCSSLCSMHFTEDLIDRSSQTSVRLRENAIPNVFTFPPHLLDEVVGDDEFALYEVREQTIDEVAYDSDDESPMMAVEATYNCTETTSNTHYPIKSEVDSEQGEDEHTQNGTYGHRSVPGLPKLTPASKENNLKLSALKTQMEKEDVCSSYGTYVGNKLREYSKTTQAIVVHHISSILFQADIGDFEDTKNKKSAP